MGLTYPRFFSHLWSMGASGIDFFAQDLDSQCPLSEHTESDTYSYSSFMAFIQLLVSFDKQISVVH